jgi:hypothetical protein
MTCDRQPREIIVQNADFIWNSEPHDILAGLHQSAAALRDAFQQQVDDLADEELGVDLSGSDP